MQSGVFQPIIEKQNSALHFNRSIKNMSIDSSRIFSNRLIAHPAWLRLMAHLQSPLLRNGYALVFSSVATSALGVFYWLLAANYYSAEIVGINAALINAMLFLSQTAQLNLGNGINRFLPTAGKQTKRFVGAVYALILAASPFVCLIYFAGLKSWAPLLDSVFADRMVALGFVIATMAWSIFAMQDNVLIGMRQATWVPIENLLFAVAKIILLISVATMMTKMGIFFSWVAPMMTLLLPVNWFIFRHLAPKHIESTRQQSEPLTVGGVAHYVGGDYFGSLVWTATVGLMPLIVLERVGATASGYFAIAWTISNSLYLVSRNMGMSLISEASLDRQKLTLYSQHTLLQTLKLIVPVTLFVVIAAPLLLRLFGKEYSGEATRALQFLALSAIPASVTTIYVSVARVQRWLLKAFVVQASLCGSVLLLSILLLERIGITGVGLAWLIGQTFVAIVLLFSELRVGLRNEALLRIASNLRSHWTLWHSRRKMTQLKPLVNSILARLQAQLGDGHWQVQRIVPVLADVTVVHLGGDADKPSAILKFPGSELSACYSKLQQQTLQALHDRSELGEGWLALVPKLLLAGEEGGQHYAVESIVPGVAMEKRLDQPEMRSLLLNSATETIRHLHQSSAVSRTVDEELLALWVTKPLAQLQRLYAVEQNADKLQVIEGLGEELRRSLAGKSVITGWSHGDFAPCNILVSEDGAAITGIVDWEQSLTADLPLLDIVFLLLAVRSQLEAKEFGKVVTELLVAGQWHDAEASLLQRAQLYVKGEKLDHRTLILLVWLRHVSMTVDKSERYRNHPIWRRNNVDQVLSALTA